MDVNFNEKRKFLNVSEFSEITGIPDATVREHLGRGTLKGTKLCQKWLIPMKELERLNNPE